MTPLVDPLLGKQTVRDINKNGKNERIKEALGVLGVDMDSDRRYQGKGRDGVSNVDGDELLSSKGLMDRTAAKTGYYPKGSEEAERERRRKEKEAAEREAERQRKKEEEARLLRELEAIRIQEERDAAQAAILAKKHRELEQKRLQKYMDEDDYLRYATGMSSGLNPVKGNKDGSGHSEHGQVNGSARVNNGLSNDDEDDDDNDDFVSRYRRQDRKASNQLPSAPQSQTTTNRGSINGSSTSKVASASSSSSSTTPSNHDLFGDATTASSSRGSGTFTYLSSFWGSSSSSATPTSSSSTTTNPTPTVPVPSSSNASTSQGGVDWSEILSPSALDTDMSIDVGDTTETLQGKELEVSCLSIIFHLSLTCCHSPSLPCYSFCSYISYSPRLPSPCYLHHFLSHIDILDWNCLGME